MNDIDNNPAGEQDEAAAARVSRRRLELIAASLHGRDRDILRALQESRFMTSKHISRQHFESGHANPAAAQRAANRAMRKLRGCGLVTTIYRRVGGAQGGSSGFVWALTPAGHRLLGLNSGEAGGDRRRRFEPSQRFVEHTLAVSELHVRLRGMEGIALTDVRFEPDCWRNYTGRDGARQQLKPDLYAVTSDGEYEDLWFFEIDLATEAPSRVLSKCGQYQDYYRSGIEQRRLGVFPMVAWVVPDAKRRETLQIHIAQCAALTDKGIFTFVLPGELDALVRKGAGV